MSTRELPRGIYALADDDPRWKHAPLTQVEAALAGGARWLQLRFKHARDRDALALARAALERTRAAGAFLVVNDRFDLADLAGADGVHLGQDDLPPDAIPPAVRARLLVGWSTHTPEQVARSRTLDVDYIGYGPVFGTASKDSEYTRRGLEGLADACRAASVPVVAIGGIGREQIPDVRAAGAAAAALISAIAAAEDPAAATRDLVRAWNA